ncbi:MAG: tetratricopeptide repeat protein [Planctomycetota bacterium]
MINHADSARGGPAGRKRRHRAFGAATLALAGMLAVAPAGAQDGDDGSAGEARMQFKAKEMLDRGLTLLEQKQTDRAVKVLESVPRMYPKARARFAAHLALGRHYLDERKYDLAAKQFNAARQSADDDERAEAIYRLGICHYHRDDFDNAFIALRQVTQEYPWSAGANQAYYYIGQCHFRLGRWAKAVEALQMVGTSVPPASQGELKVEAGQRLFVKVHDQDLVVRRKTGEPVTVVVRTAGGDRQTVTLSPLGDEGRDYIGSVPTTLGQAAPDDGVLQIIGHEQVEVLYTDAKTRSGEVDRKIVGRNELVSTAAVGFTDGAYREYTEGVFGDSDCFMRVKDLDRDRSGEPDTVSVRVRTQYKLQREQQPPSEQLEFVETEQPEWEARDEVEATLTETGPHTGVFVGSIVPAVVSDASEIRRDDDELSAMKGDRIVMTYVDHAHMHGDEPREVTATAQMLIGRIRDVKIEQRVVEEPELKARKNLIEAKIYRKLGQIFKDVGLDDDAADKAQIGLDRVNEVLRMSASASLDRQTVEQAFNVKWDLLLVQGKLSAAIDVCRTLTQLFPDSTLVDRALLDIGKAKMRAGLGRDAMGVFSAILRLPTSDLKPEAMYLIAEVRAAEARRRDAPDLSHAMLAYKRVADTYPDSSFAGDALEKIAQYYIDTKDYARAVELMERVFMDYPDAGFLDKMLLKWVQAAYRMGDLAAAKEKCDQLLAEFPASPLSGKAKEFRATILRKMGG